MIQATLFRLIGGSLGTAVFGAIFASRSLWEVLAAQTDLLRKNMELTIATRNRIAEVVAGSLENTRSTYGVEGEQPRPSSKGLR